MRADLFCRVIDNFGDIGVSWRLARQLAAEHGWSIRLWVDDLLSFQKLEPRLATTQVNGRETGQVIEGVEIVRWTDTTQLSPAPAAFALFSCDLPESYLDQMRTQSQHNPTLWINLEYLSAEDWVESCHALPSLRSDGLSSYFFFPGFTAQTGGLLREAGLLARRNAWRDDHGAQSAFLKSLGISTAALEAWQGIGALSRARLISLFCYPNAPIQSLVEQLAAQDRPSILLLPQGIAPHLHTGQLGKLFLERIPFVPQPEYDKILWTADLNFVRGEDSVVRAIWAGKPLVWQIYSQTENTHLLKLDAWLARSGLPDSVQQLERSWNPPSAQESSDLLSAAQQQPDSEITPHSARSDNTLFASLLAQNLTSNAFKNWQESTDLLTDTLAAQADLATSLDRFVRNKMPVEAISAQKG